MFTLLIWRSFPFKINISSFSIWKAKVMIFIFCSYEVAVNWLVASVMTQVWHNAAQVWDLMTHVSLSLFEFVVGSHSLLRKIFLFLHWEDLPCTKSGIVFCQSQDCYVILLVKKRLESAVKESLTYNHTLPRKRLIAPVKESPLDILMFFLRLLPLHLFAFVRRTKRLKAGKMAAD